MNNDQSSPSAIADRGIAISINTRLQFAHAVAQTLATERQLRLLHLKGPAALQRMRPPGKVSTDADILVHPDDVNQLETALSHHGWEQRTTIEGGSAFSHAANWWHTHWGYLDLHAYWPGPKADPKNVFAQLSRGDHTVNLAQVSCPVPDEAGQLLVLLLHAARTTNKADVTYGWGGARPELQQRVRELAAELRAELPLAIALGESADTTDPEYDLWQHYSSGATDRISEWKARVKAAPGLREKIHVLISASQVNQDHLRLKLGHSPSPAEVRQEQLRRLKTLAQQGWQRLYKGHS